MTTTLSFALDLSQLLTYNHRPMNPQSCIKKTIEFDAGHRLRNHKGKCRNVHGHRYTATLEVFGRLDNVGVVLDFDDLKTTWGGLVMSDFDHAYIYESGDEVGTYLKTAGFKTYELPSGVPPTAERLALWLCCQAIHAFNGRDLEVLSVELAESPTSRASCRAYEATACMSALLGRRFGLEWPSEDWEQFVSGRAQP